MVVLSLMAGLKSGLVDSVFSLASWVVGGLVAFRASGPILSHLPARFQGTSPGRSPDRGPSVPGDILRDPAHRKRRRRHHRKAGRAGLDRFSAPSSAWRGGSSSPRGGVLPRRLPSPRFADHPGSRALPLLAPAGRVVAGLAPDRCARVWIVAGRASRPPQRPAGRGGRGLDFDSRFRSAGSLRA